MTITLPEYISERDAIVGTWEGPAVSRYVSASSLDTRKEFFSSQPEKKS